MKTNNINITITTTDAAMGATTAVLDASTAAKIIKNLNKAQWAKAHKLCRKPQHKRLLTAKHAAKKAAEAAAHALRIAQVEEESRRRAETKNVREQLLPELNAAEAARVWTSPRSYNKAPKAELWNYKFHSFSAEVLLGRIVRQLDKASAAAEDDDGITANELFSILEKDLSRQLETKKAFLVKFKDAKIIPGKQSLAAELLGIKPGDETNMLVEVEHNISSVRVSPTLYGFLGAGDAKEGLRRFGALRELIVQILTRNGVDAVFDDGSIVNYDPWAYTASKGKAGSLYAIPRYYAENKAFVAATTLNAKLYGKGAIPTSAAELMKQRAVLFTPSAPIKTANGKRLYLHDIAMFPAIKRHLVHKAALLVDETGIHVIRNVADERNEGDGAMYFVDPSDDIENGQLRGAGMKAMLVNCSGMIETLAQLLGKDVPDLQGKKLVSTTDTWKWSKLGFDWEEFVRRVEALAKFFPTIGMLRVVRHADAVEEDGRKASRQLLQQFMDVKNVQDACKRDERWLKRFSTLEGAAAVYGAHRKDAIERTAFEQLFFRCPDILASEPMKADVEARWNDHLADAAYGRVMVDGSYPYIVTDPVAILSILLFGADPDKEQGLLREWQINAPGLRDLQEVLITRYPCNFFNSSVVTNINFTEDMVDLREVYAKLGNVMVLPYHSIILVLADGDVDGDEMSIIESRWFVDQFKATMRLIGQDELRLPILFAHEKAELRIFSTREELMDALAHTIMITNDFGGEVGKNSLLATRGMHKAACFVGDRIKFNEYLFDAVYAYVGSVLAIDLAKTGYYPEWLVAKLKAVKAHVGKLPWNQIFRCHSSRFPWWKVVASEEKLYNSDLGKDATYQRESKKAVVDRIARYLIDNCVDTGSEFHFDTQGHVFNVSVLLNEKYGSQAKKGTVSEGVLRQIAMRNFLENGEDRAVLRDAEAGKKVSPSELIRFFWRNAATLSRRMDRESGLGSREADWLQRQEYYEFVRFVLMNLDETMPEEERTAVVTNWAVRLAFGDHNGIGKDAATEEERTALKGSFCRFVLQVFAQDILHNVEENQHVPVEERFDTLRIIDEDQQQAETTEDLIF